MDNTKLVNTWFKYVDLNNFFNKKINFLNLSPGDGSLVISFAETYGKHSGSKYYCIDSPPDSHEREILFETFLNNINNHSLMDKVVITR